MAKIGVFCLPMPSHLSLFLTLARALATRGHRIVFFGIRANEPQIRNAGFDFCDADPDGTATDVLTKLKQDIGKCGGFAAMRAQGRFDELRYEAILRNGPDLVRGAAIDGIIADQAEACSGSVAETTRLPWVSVSSALAPNTEPDIPLLFTTWGYSEHPLAVMRNRMAHCVLELAAIRTRHITNLYRSRWGLRPLRQLDDAFSPFAQISQLIREFDFPRKELPDYFHYVGPIRAQSSGPVPFPWKVLDNRPLIYASLGTVNQHRSIYEKIAQACAGLDVQLVMSLGGAAAVEQFKALPGSPLVVGYAPQLQLLERASLCITHGGLNTTLESLAAGVPLVAIPINFDQFGVAARIRWTGTGEFVKRGQLTVAHLRSTIEKVLFGPNYARAARHMRDLIALTNGAERAGYIVEEVILMGKPLARRLAPVRQAGTREKYPLCAR